MCRLSRLKQACPIVVVVADWLDSSIHESVEVLYVMQSRNIGLYLLPLSLGLRGFRTARTAIRLHSIGFLFRIIHVDRNNLNQLVALHPALMTNPDLRLY